RLGAARRGSGRCPQPGVGLQVHHRPGGWAWAANLFGSCLSRLARPCGRAARGVAYLRRHPARRGAGGRRAEGGASLRSARAGVRPAAGAGCLGRTVGLAATEQAMSASERGWALGFALAMLLFTSLPYALALTAGPHTFTGFLIG